MRKRKGIVAKSEKRCRRMTHSVGDACTHRVQRLYSYSNGSTNGSTHINTTTSNQANLLVVVYLIT